jgi:putative transposase
MHKPIKNRKPNRMLGFDYASEALYFVTSCVQDMVCNFGKIIDGQMICNEYGKIAEKQWEWLQTQYPYIESHAFVVMPNHIHAVLEIVWTGRDLSSHQTGTGRDLSIQPPPKIKSLSELMGAYKTTSSKQIHLAGLMEFRWQRSFHDHIIRTNEAYNNIVNYIETNPQRWKNDKFHE